MSTKYEKLTTPDVSAAAPQIEHSSKSSQDLIVGLRTAIDQTAAHIYIKDMAGRYTYVNQKVQEYFGAKSEDIVGKTDRQLMEQEIADHIARDDSRVLVCGEQIEREEKIVAKSNGESMAYWIVKKPLLNEHGQIIGLCGVSTDITERKQSDAPMRRNQALMQNSMDGIHIMDIEGNVIEVNDAFCNMLGYTREEALRLNVTNWNAEVAPEVLRERLKSFIGKHARFETIHRRKDGTLISVEISTSGNEIDGKVYLHAISRDITERKKAETELRIAAAAFESQGSVVITDTNGVIQRVNKAFTESTGYTADEAVGQTPRLLKSDLHDAEFYRTMWGTLVKTGSWQGEIWDRRKNGEIFPKLLTISSVKGDDGIVTHYVGAHIDITERKAAEKKIRQLAFHDTLTLLPNRLLLLDRLHLALASSARSGLKGALLFIDLDNFKTINDTLGHAIGDLLLQQVAERLVSCVREGDTVARLGGDEFVVMLEDLSEQTIDAAEQTEAVGEKVLAALSKTYKLGKHMFYSSGSIGVTVFNEDPYSAEELLKQADIAMYQAKRAGRNTLRFFDPQMQESINARATLERELHNALDNQQFQLYYQLQVDSSNCPLGAEALIRWIHRDHGVVSPAQFIPLAEETGLIIPIGKWVLNAACAQLKIWACEEQTRNLVLSVNISTRQFCDADFVDQVQATLQYHAINPKLLKLEITEGMLLENIEETIGVMNRLNVIGVMFSLDDFGTGYSSLQYLKRLPLNQLKIDQSFVRDIAIDSSDKAIVSTIIAMAQSLGLNVIAEGVETEDQRQFLLDIGCTQYQGYLFGKPMPIEQFEALLHQE
jgi:diguanylate cyclase (GGDEF)-like protein/PAS domain S-box-containing protein